MKWWKEIEELLFQLGELTDNVSDECDIDSDARLFGQVKILAGTKVGRGATIEGPVTIGRNCLIGNNAFIRGPAMIGDDVRIGFTAEIKNSIIEDGVRIGPLCFVSDSMVCRGSYLGAMVRTSNHRLDQATIKVLVDGELVDTHLSKLGAYIGAESRLGIQVVILPGRVIAPGTTVGPMIVIEKNLPTGIYVLKQELKKIEEKRRA